MTTAGTSSDGRSDRLSHVAPPPLAPELVEHLRARLPDVASVALTSVVQDVPEYAATLTSEMARDVRREIGAALGAFLALVERGSPGVDGAAPIAAGREGAYALGRGEARAGRTMEALLAAYRVGARVCWRELSTAAVASPTPPPAEAMATFAELVFAYIDELSAASIAGHTDELAASGRLRARRLAQLTRALVVGATPEVLAEQAEQASWPPPRTLTAVLLPAARLHDTLPRVDVRTLHGTGDEVDLPDDTAVLLVPDVDVGRPAVLAALASRDAVVGTTHPWTSAATSLRLALRAAELPTERRAGPASPTDGDGSGATPRARHDAPPVDAEAALAALVVAADREAHGELRVRALAPFDDLRPATAERLTATLRAWLLHQGRRRDVAAALHVHPQTVRYRMTQVRELFGDALDDPAAVEALVVALALPPDGPPAPGA